MNLTEMLRTLKAAESCIETPANLNDDEIGRVLADLRHAIEIIEVKMEMSA